MIPLTLCQVTTSPGGLLVAVADAIFNTDDALVGLVPVFHSCQLFNPS